MSLRNVCTVCEGTSFENIDGFYFCLICGTKAQSAIDIELNEDAQDFNDVRQIKQAAQAQKPKTSKDDDNQAKDVEEKFSTFEVYSYVLRRQCDDLINLGANPIIKDVVLRLWAKYLKKLGICFLEGKKSKINRSNFKWRRDVEYLLVYELNARYEEDQARKKMKEEEMDFGDDKSVLTRIKACKSEPNLSELVDDDHKRDSSLFYESDEEDGSRRSCDDDDVDYSETSRNLDELGLNKKMFNDFMKFEWIRMAHTIALVNLALLALKSEILISDIVRFIYNGNLSYFNIDELLPKSMKFTYGEDSRMFNRMTLPSTDFLRCLTFQLADFLQFDKIKLVDMRLITSRFIIDLNLPDQLDPIVNMLMERVKPIDEFDFRTDRFKNLEAIALSYIFTAILVVFIYDCNNNDENDQEAFSLSEWIRQMNTNLIEHNLIGHTYEEVDLQKLMQKKHRFVEPKNIKTYKFKCRRSEYQRALKEPLKTLVKDHENNENMEMSDNFDPLFHIKRFMSSDFSDRKINRYLTEEKFAFFESNDFKSEELTNFIKVAFDDTKLRGEYLLGYRMSQIDWMLAFFHELAQTKSFNKMYFYVRSLVNKLLNK